MIVGVFIWMVLFFWHVYLSGGFNTCLFDSACESPIYPDAAWSRKIGNQFWIAP